MRTFLIALLALGVGFSPGSSVAGAYLPIGQPSTAPDARAYVSLGEVAGAAGLTDGAFKAVKIEDRPIMPGQRPVQVELLEDSLRRKQPRKIGDSRIRADEAIVRNALRDPVKRSHIRGHMAEARYLYENPEWGYVSDPRAPQVDVYRWQAGTRKPFGAQVKTHASDDPNVYARDMLKDDKAELFLVPDEHVEGLRDLWRNRLQEARGRGAISEAKMAEYHLNRVHGLGFSNKDLDDDVLRAAGYLLREDDRKYVSLGAGRALVKGSSGWELWRNGRLSAQSTSTAMRAESILAAKRAETLSLETLGSKPLPVGLRGGMWAVPILAAADVSLFVYENGGNAAFESQEFYARLGGNMGALIGVPIGQGCYSYVTPWAVPIVGVWGPAIGGGAALLCAGAAGIVGYLSGETASRKILELINPDFLHKAEESAIADARTVVSTKIQMTQRAAALQHHEGDGAEL